MMAARQPVPTLRDVAERAGVSLATASRVLNPSERIVGDRLRQRVLDAAAAVNYVPNAHAQALAGDTSSTVGVIVHDVSDPYFSAIASGVFDVADRHGLLVVICNAHRDPLRELQYVSMLRSQRVRAIVLAGSAFEATRHEDRMSRELSGHVASGGKVAVISRATIDANRVLPDNRGGGGQLGTALTELGPHSFAVLGGPVGMTTGRDRLAGFRDALGSRGVHLDPRLVLSGDFSRSGGHAAAIELLDRGIPFSALVALNDLMAIGALAALKERGIHVPDDISLTGFDDIEAVRDVEPAITTVRVPMAEMGARAVTLALADSADDPIIEHVPVEVVLRASTGPPARIRPNLDHPLCTPKEYA
ncbi:LacI family DNA-binding transcriptional regulator [soil metagenome]